MKTIRLFTHTLLLILILFGTISCSDEIKPIQLDYFTPSVKTALASIKNNILPTLGTGLEIGAILSSPLVCAAFSSEYYKTAGAIYSVAALGVAAVELRFLLHMDISASRIMMKNLEKQSEQIAKQYTQANKALANQKNVLNTAQFLLNPHHDNQPENSTQLADDTKALEDFIYNQLSGNHLQKRYSNMEWITNQNVFIGRANLTKLGKTNLAILGKANLAKLEIFNKEIEKQKNIAIIREASEKKEFKTMLKAYEIKELQLLLTQDNDLPLSNFNRLKALSEERRLISEYKNITNEKRFASLFPIFTPYTLPEAKIIEKLQKYNEILGKLHRSIENQFQLYEQISNYENLRTICTTLKRTAPYYSQEDLNKTSATLFNQNVIDIQECQNKVRLYQQEITKKTQALNDYKVIIETNRLPDSLIFQTMNKKTNEWHIEPPIKNIKPAKH